MNSVTTNRKAERIARCALRGALACALLLGGAHAALAQQYGDRRDDPSMQQNGRGERGTRFQLPPQDRDARYDQQRAYEEQRRAQQQQQQQQQYQDGRDARHGNGRLTPDERRDLRRQINEAGMDLYPTRR